MATLVGKVGMVMKGDYNSASTYETLDVVSYQNALYIAKQSVPAGTVPTNTTYWQLGINKASAQKIVLTSTPFGSGESATLSDNVSNYDFLDIRTNESTDAGATRGKMLVSIIDGRLDSVWVNDYLNSYMRIEASTNTFTLVSAVDYRGATSTRKVHKITGIKIA